MARKSSTKPPARPVPRRVDAIVFSLAMQTGDVEVIGIPFDHRGRTWAIHAIVGLPIEAAPVYTVSDVLTGRHVPGSEAQTLDAARAAAIATLDAVTDTSWAEAFGVTAQPATA
ncbi:hypothetical protein E2P84_43350 [Burkholderia cepacia]|uniref:Uncharacterized protein n=1 Tax=Burkholderia cepacia TaxID=292 RepID=A0AAX2R9I2_BURCE|nr:MULTISPECIES: hypothetical protein [Burkholderia]KGC70069.1 hypothetical protein DP57_5965 [Burkholderia pseudomallei]MBK1824249.1 hypothetical protein [Burkholderia orbicola]MDF3089161.1 hypothetical protein [Burkholderia semiarida]TES61628.1 hypothetical protein E2P84_43350 [Burkholderia cepacia]TES95766.1 hypothetical protein E3D36_37615 [Burkholderia cepacia]